VLSERKKNMNKNFLLNNPLKKFVFTPLYRRRPIKITMGALKKIF
jgi:hypothetical protein